MTVHFERVGRLKKCWSGEIGSVSHRTLLAEVRKHGQLMSRVIDFFLDEDGQGGSVIVGGFRAVGRFRLEGAISLGTITINDAEGQVTSASNSSDVEPDTAPTKDIPPARQP